MDLTISIVSFNTKDLLRRCLTSLYEHAKGITFEVIVVDNNSSDGSREMVKKEFPRVTLIANKENMFFAKANNQALQIAKGEFFLILNSDTFFADNSLKKLVAYLKSHRDIGAIDGLEIYEDGKLVQTGSLFSNPRIDFYELSFIGKRFKNKKMVDMYRIRNKNRKETFEIDVACDAFLCTRTDILKKIGGYDEDYYLYYTENDLCKRIKKEGYRVIHYGNAYIYHAVSASVAKIGWKKLDMYYHDLWLYYWKHGYPIQGTLLFVLLKYEEVLLKIFRPHMMRT